MSRRVLERVLSLSLENRTALEVRDMIADMLAADHAASPVLDLRTLDAIAHELRERPGLEFPCCVLAREIVAKVRSDAEGGRYRWPLCPGPAVARGSCVLEAGHAGEHRGAR